MTLKDNQLFRGLTEDEIKIITPMVRSQVFPAGSVLIEEGQTDKVLFMLIRGKVNVLKKTPDRKEILIAHRHAGDFFGEMALLEDAPRSARIVTAEECEVGLIDDTTFNTMMEIEPKIAVNLLKAISARLRYTSDQIIDQFTKREAEQKKQIERLHQLVEICKAITAQFDKNHLLSFIPRAVLKQIHCDEAFFILLDDPSKQMIVSDGKSEGVRVLSQAANPFSLFAGTSRLQIVSNPAEFAGKGQPETSFLWDQCSRLMMIPVSSPEHFDGWIILKSSHPEEWVENDTAFLETLASYVAVALQNMRLSVQVVTNEKLTAVGRASSSIIHDFKNLLSVVHIYAQMILKSKGPDDTKELVDKILTSSHLMITMSREILTFARGEIILNREKTGVRKLVQNPLSLIELELKRRNISLSLDIPESHEYDFDAEKMCRAVYNLLKNASESIEKTEGTIRLSSDISGRELCITISDNGKGIPEAVLQTMFTPFVTTKSDGTGLGMLIVKNIIEAHGGQIDIESREGQGTDILLTFPLS